MTIIVKLPSGFKFVIPHMCVACGSNTVNNVISRTAGQFGSHTTFFFPVCEKCAKYDVSTGGRIPRGSKYKLLPAEEKMRAFFVQHCVEVRLPYFYLGKMTLAFLNDTYGILFWKLNGGEMSVQHSEMPEFN